MTEYENDEPIDGLLIQPPFLSPRSYFDEMVRPAVEVFLLDEGSKQKAVHAAVSLFYMVEYVCKFADQYEIDWFSYKGNKKLENYRLYLINKCSDFRIIESIALIYKHYAISNPRVSEIANHIEKLERHRHGLENPQVFDESLNSSAQDMLNPIRFHSEVKLRTESGAVSISSACKSVMFMWEAEIDELKMDAGTPRELHGGPPIPSKKMRAPEVTESLESAKKRVAGGVMCLFSDPLICFQGWEPILYEMDAKLCHPLRNRCFVIWMESLFDALGDGRRFSKEFKEEAQSLGVEHIKRYCDQADYFFTTIANIIETFSKEEQLFISYTAQQYTKSFLKSRHQKRVLVRFVEKGELVNGFVQRKNFDSSVKNIFDRGGLDHVIHELFSRTADREGEFWAIIQEVHASKDKIYEALLKGREFNFASIPL